MNLKENNIFGRKVFFLCPTFDFQKIIIERLFNLEYEVYVIHNVADAKNILIHYPDSICFINIDSSLDSPQWFNFVHSFEQDPVLSTIFLGIISHQNKIRDKELFLLNAEIPAGFISTAANYDELTKTFVNILELNGAMGRRKYIRTDCSRDRFVFARLTVSTETYDLKIKDISSIGFSVDIPIIYENQIKLNLVVRNCTIKIHDKSIIEPCTMIIANPQGENIHVVMVFLKGMSFASKAVIRSYIHSNLQKNLAEILRGCIPDTTDYSVSSSEESDIKEPFTISSPDDTIEELEKFDESDLTLTNLF